MSRDVEFSQYMRAKSDADSFDDFSKFKRKKESFFGKEGTIVGGKVGSAIGAAVDRPELITEQLPVAAAKALEGFTSMFNPSNAINPGRSISEAASDYINKDLPEELKEGANDLADIESLFMVGGVGGVGRQAAKTASKMKKPPRPINVGREEIFEAPSIKSTYKSGLTKLEAVNAPFAEKAIISPARQEKAIQGLEKETADLTRKAVEKHLPMSKKIEEGFDFEALFEKEFTDLKAAAEKYNPQINITPLSKYFSEIRERYRGIPELHSQAKKIKKEISSFQSNPQTGLKNLLRIRRSNGRKLNEIYERRLMTGKQQEYADFLTGMNRKIDEAIFSTLPEDSEWANKYKEMNSHYAQYQNTRKALEILEPVLGGRLDTSKLRQLPKNPKAQKKLKILMGEEGANEITQIGSDLNSAIDSVKKMSVAEYSKYDAALPLAYLLPGIGKGMTAARGIHYARRAYGFMLSQPSTRKAYDKALKAIAEHDLNGYKEAAKEISASQLNQ